MAVFETSGAPYPEVNLPGTITFTAVEGNETLWAAPFEGKHRPAGGFFAAPDKMYTGALWRPHPGSFVSGLTDMVSSLFGVDPLIKALTENNLEMQLAITKKLADMRATDAVVPLIGLFKLLKKKGVVAVNTVVEALGKMGDTRAVEPLLGELKSEYSWDRSQSAAALMKITGEDFGEDHNKWSEWWAQRKERHPVGK